MNHLRRSLYALLSILMCVLLISCIIAKKSETGEFTMPKIPPQTEPIHQEHLTDIDGNVYPTVRIGNQVWTVHNLRTTRYNDSTPIALVTDEALWRKATTGAFCYYDNDDANQEKYGVLYNWYAIKTEKLAPEGWRIPTDSDWAALEKYLMKNGYNSDGSKTGTKIGKALAAKGNWAPHPTSGAVGNNVWNNNSTGFSALGSGYRYLNGDFFSLKEIGFFWSSTENNSSYAWDRHIAFDENRINRESRHKRWGLSVRLVSDVQ